MSYMIRSVPSLVRWLPATSNSSSKSCLRIGHQITCRRRLCSIKEGVVFATVNVHQQTLANILSRRIHSSCVLRKEVIPFKLSDIGEGIKEVTIKEWFVKEGDIVAQFDQICEVQSDKASVTITSRYDGIVTKIYHKVDEMALVGNPLVDIEIQSAGKVSDEQFAEVQEGDAIQVGQAEESVSLPPAFPSSTDKALATPAVRRIASEYKVDLKNVQGTGRDGRVLKEDILIYVSKMGGKPQESPTRPSSVAAAAAAAVKPAAVSAIPAPVTPPLPPPINRALPDRKESIKGYTRTMIKTMTAANEIPHFGYSDEISVAELNKLRRDLKVMGEIYNVKVTLMPLFLKAASLALSRFPIINSTLDLANDSIVYKGSHNIGVAMDTKLGLVVPNVKNVESKSILEIAIDLQNLQQSGQAGAFKPDDLRGGTFTMSNIGSIGGTYAKPVILPPEVAIVAIGKTQVLPRFDADGKVTAAHIINVSFSADHRVMDGATVARFCNLWKSYLEQPSSMLLYLK